MPTSVGEDEDLAPMKPPEERGTGRPYEPDRLSRLEARVEALENEREETR